MNGGERRQALPMEAAGGGGGGGGAEAGGGGSSNGGSSGSSTASSQKDILTAQLLLKKGKRYAASYLKDECLRNLSPDDSEAPHAQGRGEFLDLVLTMLLNPAMPMKDWDTVDWLKWLMAGGKTPDEFFSIDTDTSPLPSPSSLQPLRLLKEGGEGVGEAWEGEGEWGGGGRGGEGEVSGRLKVEGREGGEACGKVEKERTFRHSSTHHILFHTSIPSSTPPSAPHATPTMPCCLPRPSQNALNGTHTALEWGGRSGAEGAGARHPWRPPLFFPAPLPPTLKEGSRVVGMVGAEEGVVTGCHAPPTPLKRGVMGWRCACGVWGGAGSPAPFTCRKNKILHLSKEYGGEKNMSGRVGQA
ncbi:hypothetical protein O3P69_008957 [Scylla paramamosain]|uniref:Uncharacterized protein n=1 Tax=Scylla paramamosain TaxID=85552 RepID=A0AAW0TQ41_SCYPA